MSDGQRLDHGELPRLQQGAGFSCECNRRPLLDVKQEGDLEEGLADTWRMAGLSTVGIVDFGGGCFQLPGQEMMRLGPAECNEKQVDMRMLWR